VVHSLKVRSARIDTTHKIVIVRTFIQLELILRLPRVRMPRPTAANDAASPDAKSLCPVQAARPRHGWLVAVRRSRKSSFDAAAASCRPPIFELLGSFTHFTFADCGLAWQCSCEDRQDRSCRSRKRVPVCRNVDCRGEIHRLVAVCLVMMNPQPVPIRSDFR